jgi:1-acyl-sn-glycerol-3-phosphate acyltransferase
MSAPVKPGFYGRHQRSAKRLIGPLFRRLWTIEVTGLHQVPTVGPAILCPNHLAAIDSFFLPAVLERPVVYVGKAEYLDSWKTRWLFPALGMIPIDRRGGEHAQAALDAARAVLTDGGLFAIYPEGTRSRTGQLHRGKTGAARLAIETGAPIIPVGLVGTSEVQPVGSNRPRFFRRVEVRLGKPIEVDRYRSRPGDNAVYRELIDEVMFEIQNLTGQVYVDRYAGDPSPATGTVATVGPVPLLDPSGALGPVRSSAEVLVGLPLPA